VRRFLFLFAIPALRGNFLLNPSFERPNLNGVNSTRVFGTGSTDIDDWIVTGGGPSTVSIVRSDFTDQGLSFTPHAGDQSLNLTGNFPGEAAGVRQSVALTVGDDYRLTFWVGNQDDSKSNYPLAATVMLFLNGDFQSLFTNSNSTHGDIDWKRFVFDFTATQSVNTIRFSNGTLTFEDYVGLDSVNLEDVTGSPEPPTLLSAAVVLVVLACARRVSRKGRSCTLEHLTSGNSMP
jgi:Protein of unknown function (DUF642)